MKTLSEEVLNLTANPDQITLARHGWQFGGGEYTHPDHPGHVILPQSGNLIHLRYEELEYPHSNPTRLGMIAPGTVDNYLIDFHKGLQK